MKTIPEKITTLKKSSASLRQNFERVKKFSCGKIYLGSSLQKNFPSKTRRDFLLRKKFISARR
ncbi:MAG: hypothetical protein IKP64_05985 [Selenomonadaceae bacterium]|nr:hypothetical protein [Selenomonadaceae bacterium]MBR4383091.1 hypothetical protein [Selenomonadaceae bacterium]